MNIEEVKEWRKRNMHPMHHVIQGDADKIDWLIAECERLEEELAHYHSIEYAGKLQKKMQGIAERCAEIAETHEHAEDDFVCCGMNCSTIIAADIRREFSL